MTRDQLDAVRDASKRERAHYKANRVVAFGISVVCYCDTCKADREVIAMWTPVLLEYIDNAMAEPRRAHSDLGDLD
jgi:hypothetical protein